MVCKWVSIIFHERIGLHGFTIGGADPKGVLHGGHAGEDEVVVVGIGDVGGGHIVENCKNQLQI